MDGNYLCPTCRPDFLMETHDSEMCNSPGICSCHCLRGGIPFNQTETVEMKATAVKDG